MELSVTLIALPKDYTDVNDLIDVLNSQSIRPQQLILMVADRFTYDFVIRNAYLLQTDDFVIDYSVNEDSTLLKKAFSHATGDYVWIYDNGDITSPSFLDTMLTIQTNIGADVIITDYSVNRRQFRDDANDGRITVYHRPTAVPTHIHTIHEQWLKFFRRSLIEGIESYSLEILAEKVIMNASIACRYDRKMFVSFGNTERMFCNSDVIGCSWEIQYSKLVGRESFCDEKKIHITIGICAYNEQYVIERTIRSIFTQKGECFCIDKVIVVSSGSTDDTDMIIEELAKEFTIIHPIYQVKREGKNSAVNEIIRNSSSEVVVIYNADNVFASEYTLDMLIRPFFDDTVGVTGGHPIPVNSSESIPDYTVQLMWSVHHFVSMQSPNIGELIAFRNNQLELPTDSQGDEGIIRAVIEKEGFRTVYVPEAMVYNRGPTTVREFLNQRKRVNVGEIKIKNKTGFDHPTHNARVLATAFISSVRQFGVKPFKVAIAVSLEYLSRLLAKMYVRENKDDISIWDQVRTTKKL